MEKNWNAGAVSSLRLFAMTLKFYSTKAYNCVRKSFDLGLPRAILREMFILSYESTSSGVVFLWLSWPWYTDINKDSLPEATDTLVFMAISVNSSWKMPCVSFSWSLTGAEKAKPGWGMIHKAALSRTTEITCRSVFHLQAYIPNILETPVVKIYIFLDACHMIKLVRNTISD